MGVRRLGQGLPIATLAALHRSMNLHATAVQSPERMIYPAAGGLHGHLWLSFSGSA